MPDLSQNPTFVKYCSAFRDNPGSIVFVPLAQMLIDNGMLDEASTVINEGLRLNPGLITGRLARARLCMATGRADEAARELEAIIKDAPGNTEAEGLLKRAREKQAVSGQRFPPEADQPLAEAVGGDEQTSAVHPPEFATITMARIYASQGWIEEAKRIYGEILAREPGNEVVKKELDGLLNSKSKLQTSK